jgi:hypothetical protein
MIYEPVSAEAKAFIEFWAARYTGYDDDFYEANVGQELTEARILEWFEWKNGTPLSELKRNSVLNNFVARRRELHHWKPGVLTAQAKLLALIELEPLDLKATERLVTAPPVCTRRFRFGEAPYAT